MEAARQALARTGLANSPFGRDILAGQNMSGNSSIADIGPQIASNFINMAPGVGLDTGGLSAASNAAGLDTRTHGNSTPSMWDQFLQGFEAPSAYVPGAPGPSSSATPPPPSGSPVSMQDQFAAGDSTGMGAGTFAGASYG